jgi:hypothetical protein
LRLRPLPLSELLDELFRMYRRNFPLMATTALALEVPALLLNLLTGQYRSFGFLFNLFSAAGNPERIAALTPPRTNPLYLVIGYLVVLLLVPFSTGLLIRATTDVAMGRPTTVMSAVRRTLRRYFALAAFDLLAFVAGLVAVAVVVTVFIGGIALGSQGNGNGVVIVLTVLLVLALSLATIVGAVWIGIRLVVVVPVMLEEGVGPIAGIRRSWSLVRGSFWRITGTLVVVYALGQVVQSALSAVLLLLVFFLPGLSGDARGGLLLVALAAVQVLVSPIFAITLALVYFDLRVRRESLDLDQLASAARP